MHLRTVLCLSVPSVLDLLDRPVENLVMNHANNFRDTQEQRELLNRVMPLIHSGYVRHTEFWSLPQCYGDDMSGIRATLTRTEQGQPKPVTHVAQPRSIRQEAGTHGHLKPFGPVFQLLLVVGIHLKLPKKATQAGLDPLAKYDDARSRILLIPALRFCGQSASWTGNSTANKGQVGIKSTVIFEALMGESASSHLELHNEGSTAIFYSWKQLVVPRSFPNLRSQTKAACFYFNCSSGVILPGDTQRLEVIFKSEKPGIETELWQLNTHPVLMQGASMQVTLRGVAFYQDNTADQRLFIEMKLERLVMVKLCRSIVYEALQGVRTPERPSSPKQLPKSKHSALKGSFSLRHIIHMGGLDSCSIGVDTYTTIFHSCVAPLKAVMSLPESTQEVMLSRLNSLCLKLCEPLEMKHQLWRKLLDSMVAEDIWIRNLLDLPEREITGLRIPFYLHFYTSSPQTSISRCRPSPTVSCSYPTLSSIRPFFVQDNREREKKQEEAGKRAARELETALLTDTCPGSAPQPADQNLDPNLISMNTRLLHAKASPLALDWTQGRSEDG
uniref:Uncharacterized protein n=1 Tax=Mola mola TaxID=94237 RepID=A0A3Q3XRK1_MOLML